MIKPTLIGAQCANRRLQKSATSNYSKLLSRLCRDHELYSEVRLVQSSLKAGDYATLLELADSFSSTVYDDITKHFVMNQFSSLIKKYPFPQSVLKMDRDGVAKTKFLRADKYCHRVNQRFRARASSRKPLPFESNLCRARDFITYVIGHRPDIDSILNRGGFGPGASIGVHGNATNASRKLLAERWSVTPGTYYYAYVSIMKHAQFREILLPEHGGFTSGDPSFRLERVRYKDRVNVVRHNKIVFVPKTAKTSRSIAIEPLLTGYVQKGIDLALRDRLRRVGLDLNTQDANRELARQGSLDDTEDSFVTIDLSSASDSISTEIVRTLLPPEWFEFLDSNRSHDFELDGKFHQYSKFCSMGNGFCFPLETLIFAALVHSVGAGTPGRDYLVYGDDIIVRRKFSAELINLMSYAGFSVNKEKTFLQGPFRESCGSDWFLGKDVRPFTLDFELNSIQSVFKILNLSRRNEKTSLFFESVREFLLTLLPEDYRFYRPVKGPADTGIDGIGDEHLFSPHCKFQKNLQCWSWRELVVLPNPDNYWERWDTGHIALLWGALSGSASTAPFQKRRGCRTKVRRVAHSGATAMWLPAPLT